ncbi:DUF4259 domain-containing protein [Rhizobium leguminosarum]|uniref:DUF4259 domain-containing protein n=1 Tax=Rhizobium leguminosarum TaxID=384 RepID=UPI003F97A3D8
MGTWGKDVFENDAASDWIALFDRLGFLAVTTPLEAIAEYWGLGKPIPAETEQTFWAMCEVVAIAGGLPTPPSIDDHKPAIKRDAGKILKIPNLRRRIMVALERLEASETELATHWMAAGEGGDFEADCKRLRDSVLEVLAR